MSCDNGECDHVWHYASPRTLPGALQHGLGRGAHGAADDPAAPDLVMACVRRDHRWDWLVDERDVYLARLVRDLRLPVAPIATQLYSAPWEEFDEDPTPSTWPSAYWRPSPVPDRTRRSTRSEATSRTAADGCAPWRRWHGAGRSSGGTTSGATELLPRLEALWVSPHSYERAAYLAALVRLDPTGLPRQLFEGLWDCEADVRRLAAERMPMVNGARERLRYLRDDPIETDEVRAVAAARLN